uniref:Uncharacterized protein n=1 Tax=Tanacetum cinerariifolium TaxID=118510 RepID=A0A6L2P4L2_TANCI|nr:hypothetical protein [Tanacetum cinerariifolium]
MKERQMQSRESKVVSSKALDASLVVTECSGTKNNSKESYGSNDMAHNYYLKEAKKMTQEKIMNLKPSVKSLKSKNNIKPAKRIPNVNKSERWISKGYRFSPNKSSVVHEKPNTPRSYLRWKLTGRIFKTAGLRWIPTGKMFTDCTTKVDSKPPNGSNEDITNPYKCDQTLNVSTCTLNLSAGLALQRQDGVCRQHFRPRSLEKRKVPSWSLNVYEMVKLTPGYISLGLVQNLVSPTPYVPPSKKDYKILFQPLFDEYFNPPPHVVSPVSKAITAPRAVDPASLPSLTTIDQDVPSASTSPTIQEIQS